MIQLKDKLLARLDELDKIVAECEVTYETMYYNAKFNGTRPYYEFNGEQWEQDNADVLVPLLSRLEEASVKYDELADRCDSLEGKELAKHCDERTAQLKEEIQMLNALKRDLANEKEVQRCRWQIEELRNIKNLALA